MYPIIYTKSDKPLHDCRYIQVLWDGPWINAFISHNLVYIFYMLFMCFPICFRFVFHVSFPVCTNTLTQLALFQPFLMAGKKLSLPRVTNISSSKLSHCCVIIGMKKKPVWEFRCYWLLSPGAGKTLHQTTIKNINTVENRDCKLWWMKNLFYFLKVHNWICIPSNVMCVFLSYMFLWSRLLSVLYVMYDFVYVYVNEARITQLNEVYIYIYFILLAVTWLKPQHGSIRCRSCSIV